MGADFGPGAGAVRWASGPTPKGEPSSASVRTSGVWHMGAGVGPSVAMGACEVGVGGLGIDGEVSVSDGADPGALSCVYEGNPWHRARCSRRRWDRCQRLAICAMLVSKPICGMLAKTHMARLEVPSGIATT